MNFCLLGTNGWKEDMGFTWEKTTCQGKEAAQISGYEGKIPDLVIPETIGGLPVRSIAAHAFSGRNDIRSAVLPESLVTIRPFAFYNCPELKRMELYNTTDDYYDGVIRQCPALVEIAVHCVQPENYVIVHSMLQDVDVTLKFRLLDPEGTERIRLTFPEYVNEAKEDTMARAIHFSIEGAGMAYRECVGKKALDLSETAREGYETFLRENDEKALSYLILEDEKNSSVPETRLMTERGLIGESGLDAALKEAADHERTELCSLLMEYRGKLRKNESGAAALSLEW